MITYMLLELRYVEHGVDQCCKRQIELVSHSFYFGYHLVRPVIVTTIFYEDLCITDCCL